MKLVICGNGFDLNQDLKTSYKDFKIYLEEKNFFDNYDVDVFYPFFDKEQNIDDNDIDIADLRYPILILNLREVVQNVSCWSKLEEMIAEPSYESIKDFYGFDKYSDRKQCIKAAKNDLYNLLNQMSIELKKWVSSLSYTKKPLLKEIFSDDNIYISFNYTKTLELLFSVSKDKICYVHNSCSDEKVIFGCSKDDVDSKYSKLLYRTKCFCALKKEIYKFVKPTEELLDLKIKPFLKDRDISEIYVLGHSLSSVDSPYFTYINHKYPNAKWVISYHNNRDEIVNRLRSLKINNYILESSINIIFNKYCI